MAYEGSLTESPFPQVLQRIGRSADTGILTVQGKDEIIGVTFLDGEVVSVDAVNEAPEDGLGFILEDRGLIRRDEFTALMAENQAGGGRVVDLLVERGYVSRQQMLDAVRRQTLRLCEAACSWREGQFRFYRGEQVSYERGIEPLNVDDLLASLASPGVSPVVPPGASPGVFAGDAPRSINLEPEGPPPGAISRLEDMEPEFDPFETLAAPVVQRPPIEMPDAETWDIPEIDDLSFPPLAEPRKPWFHVDIDWQSVTTPVMPGRLLGIGMLVGMVALVVLAPDRFLVPMGGQERVRDAVAAARLEALGSKIDQAARTHFLLRGTFPSSLDKLVELNLLAASETVLSRSRRLSYTAAPVSYLLAVEGEEAPIQTESIGGNFLLDPDFSPPETVDTPPLVLLD
jgi:Domain of unknown function (DUF4388)